MSDRLARLREQVRDLPKPPPVARVEVGKTMLDWLKAAGRPGELSDDDPWRPDGWTPPPPIGALFGVPVVLNEGLDPGAWRVVAHGGEILSEGVLS